MSPQACSPSRPVRRGAAESLPVLYLPEGETVEFRLDSRDVIHSFWVVDFLYKKDMIPGGHTSTFQVTPTREGTYDGKCAELCGEYHSDMLFNVKVVSVEEFEAHMQELEDQGGTPASSAWTSIAIRRTGACARPTTRASPTPVAAPRQDRRATSERPHRYRSTGGDLGPPPDSRSLSAAAPAS